MSESVESSELVPRFREVIDSYKEDLVRTDGCWEQATSGEGVRVYDVRQTYAMGDHFDDRWSDFSPVRPTQEFCWNIYQELQEEYVSRKGEPDIAGDYDHDQQFYALCDVVFKDVIYTIPNYIHIRFDESLCQDDVREYTMRLNEDDLEEVESISLNPTTDTVIPLNELSQEDLEDSIFAPADTWQLITDFSREVNSEWPEQRLITMFSFKLEEKVDYPLSWLPEKTVGKIESELDCDTYEQYSDHFVMEVTSDEKHEGYSLVFSVPPGRLGRKMDIVEKALKQWDEVLS